jgi:hypothetical protein
MLNYEVRYGFTCTHCFERKTGEMAVIAASREDARDLAIASAACPDSGSKVPSSQFVGSVRVVSV